MAKTSGAPVAASRNGAEIRATPEVRHKTRRQKQNPHRTDARPYFLPAQTTPPRQVREMQGMVSGLGQALFQVGQFCQDVEKLCFVCGLMFEPQFFFQGKDTGKINC